MRRYALPIALSAVVVLGTVLRLYGICAKSLWLDEAMTWQMQRFAPLDIIRRNAHDVGTFPPLSFLLLHCWARVFGDSEPALRSLAALAGIVTIPAVYVMTRTLILLPRTDRRLVCAKRASLGGLLAATLVALSPLHVHLSQQVRGYAPAVLLLVLATSALLRALGDLTGRGARHHAECEARQERATWAAWLAFATCSAAAAYMHHLAVVSIAVLCAFAILSVLAARRRAQRPAGAGRRRGSTRTLYAEWRLATALALLALAYLP